MAFGCIEQVKEECRDARGTAFVDTFRQDVRYGIRMLGRSTGFTVRVALTLAVGIGVNTTLFTAFNTVALRPALGKQPDRLVRFSRQLRQGYGGTLFSYPEYIYYRNANSAFSGLIARSCCFDVIASGLSVLAESDDAGEPPERVCLVSDNFFSILGVGAEVGRTFSLEGDATAVAHPVVLVSHNFWTTRLRSNSKAVSGPEGCFCSCGKPASRLIWC